MGGCLVPQRHIYSGLEGEGIEYVLVCLPVKDGKSLVADSVKEVLEKGKFYPKLVLAAGDGSGAQCFAYEECDTECQTTRREIKKILEPVKAALNRFLSCPDVFPGRFIP